MLTKIPSRLSYYRTNHVYEKGSEYEIYRLTSIFKKTATRRRFDSFIQPSDLSSLRSTAFTGGLLLTVFLIIDFLINRASFSQIVIVRMLVINPCILFSLYLTYCKPFNENNKSLRWLGAGILSIAQAGHFVVGALPGVDEFYLLSTTVITVVLGNCLMLMRFPVAFYVNVAYLIGFQIVFYHCITIDFTTFVYQSFVLIGVMIGSLHSCYLREHNKCLLFVEYDIANKRKKEVEMANRRQEELLHSLDFKNKELEQFAFIISHDLKAPLRVISGLSSVIQRKEYDKLNPQSQEDFDMIQDQINQMDGMIKGILEYSRVGKDGTEKGTENIAPILENVALTLGNKDNVSIDFPKDIPLLEGSAIKFKQVFQNLISNAIKYNDKPQCKILIRAEKQDDFVKFSLQDNGPGISPEYGERIFKLFQTLQSKGKDSTGVGLAIVKKIIDFYGGKIYLDPDFEGGARFYFTLPIFRTT